MSIEERLRLLIEGEVNSERRWKTLEEKTGINAMKWQNFWREKQRPTAEMIEAICSGWPMYAFWIGTGRVDKEAGHVSPQGVEAEEIVREMVTKMSITNK